MRRLRVTLTALSVSAVLLVGGCASATDLVHDSGRSAGGAEEERATGEEHGSGEQQKPSGRRPEVGDCRPTPQQVLDEPADPTEPVACDEQHTLETFAVIDLSTGGRAEVRRGLDTCRGRLRDYLGGRHVPATRVSWFYFLGGGSQQAEWLRCDVALSTTTASGPVAPRSDSLRGALESGVPVNLRRCLNEPPRPQAVQRLVSCTEPHLARMLPLTQQLGEPGSRYPGAEQLLEDNLPWCREQTAEVESVTSSRVEVPTRKAWEAGSVAATCWAVAERGSPLPPLGTTI